MFWGNKNFEGPDITRQNSYHSIYFIPESNGNAIYTCKWSLTSHNITATFHSIVQVTAIYEGGSESVLVPSVAIFLNPRECMCQSLDSVAGNTLLPPRVSPKWRYCFINSDCSGFYCDVSARIAGYSDTFIGNATINPCTEVLQVTIVQNPQGQVVYQGVFQDSQDFREETFSIYGINFILRIEIVHYNYSMDLEVGVCCCPSSLSLSPLSSPPLPPSLPPSPFRDGSCYCTATVFSVNVRKTHYVKLLQKVDIV